VGLLTTAQKAAIPGNRVRQTWSIIRPTSAGATPSDAVVIGVDDPTRTGDTKARVIDKGRRGNSAGNISPKVFGDIDASSYSIVVSNETGYFYRKAGSAWQYGGGYISQPRECWIKHEVEVWDGTAWTHLPCSPWIGRVVDVSYEDAISHIDGSIISGAAVIRSEGYLNAILKNTWSKEEHTQITQAIDDYDTPSLLVSSISRGWRVETFTNHVWLQLTSSLECSGRLTLNSINSPSRSDTTPSGTLHQFDIDTLVGVGNPMFYCTFTVHLTVTSGGAVYTYGYPLIPNMYSSEAASVRPW